jgi:hypothetical protein
MLYTGIVCIGFESRLAAEIKKIVDESARMTRSHTGGLVDETLL